MTVAVLGPAGLLAWWLKVSVLSQGRRSRALVEAVGDVLPSVAGLVAALLAILLAPGWNSSPLPQLGAFYGGPLLVGLLLGQALPLACATRRGYVRMLWERLATAMVSTHLGLAGLLALDLPLIKVHLGHCGFNSRTVLSWWLIAVLGAFAGLVLLYLYHLWAVRRGFVAWSALGAPWDEAGGARVVVVSPAWRRVWLWVISSVVVLAVGIVLGALGSTWLAG